RRDRDAAQDQLERSGADRARRGDRPFPHAQGLRGHQQEVRGREARPVVVTYAAGVTSILAASLLALDLAAVDRARVLKAADSYLGQPAITVTAASSPRSAGGPHDYFSEADYWWPDPANPNGPYIQKDGLTNPDNFDEHRKAMRRLSLHVPALAAAWRLSGDARYAEQAARHLRAWFVDDATRMSPHLLYSQAIQG